MSTPQTVQTRKQDFPNKMHDATESKEFLEGIGLAVGERSGLDRYYEVEIPHNWPIEPTSAEGTYTVFNEKGELVFTFTVGDTPFIHQKTD